MKSAKKTKHKLNILGKDLKLAPGDQTIRAALFDQKRNFRKIALAKKRRYKKNIMNELATKKNEGNQNDFWKILKKISPKFKSVPIHPSPMEFVKHFEGFSILKARRISLQKVSKKAP